MLQVNHIYKTYEKKPLLEGISFQAVQGETICILGPSGSGKSTLLKIIAGLEFADEGDVLWDGISLAHTPVHKRHFSLMFQDYALFPHLNVTENIMFGLNHIKMDKEIRKKRVADLLVQMNLAGFGQRRVTDLSGGEQQRVALARALAPGPRLLMLDEPLGALDRALREQLMDELRHLLHNTSLPTLYVTHDQKEAFIIADRIILLNHGKIEQMGSPAEVYQHPANAWVANFLGLTNFLQGVVAPEEPLRVRLKNGSLLAPVYKTGFTAGESVLVLVRPDSMQIIDKLEENNSFQARIRDQIFLGELFRYELEVLDGGENLTFSTRDTLVNGSLISIKINPEGMEIFPC